MKLTRSSGEKEKLAYSITDHYCLELLIDKLF